MSNKFIAIVGLIFLLGSVQAQEMKEILTLEEVISCEGINENELTDRLNEVVYEIYDSSSVKTIANLVFELNTELQINSHTIGRVGHPLGKVDFVMDYWAKDGKFRSEAHEFYFTPMKRNRYGRYEEEKGKRKAIDYKDFQHKVKVWRAIKTQSAAYMHAVNTKLKSKITENEIEW